MTLLQPGQFCGSVSNMPSSTSAGHFGHTVDIDLRYREQPVHGIVRTTEPDLLTTSVPRSSEARLAAVTLRRDTYAQLSVLIGRGPEGDRHDEAQRP